MKKILFFSAIFGLFMIGVANAAQPVVNSAGSGVDFPNDGARPTFATGQTGELNGDSSYVIKDSNIKVATTKYVGTKVNAVYSDVNALKTRANTQQNVVTANGNAITDDLQGRLVKPGSPCNTTNVNGYSVSACGYIKGTGANGTKQWVKIVGGVASGS